MINDKNEHEPRAEDIAESELSRDDTAQGTVTPTPQSEVFCPNCKGGNPLDATICMWCHQPMRAISPVQPQASPAPQPMRAAKGSATHSTLPNSLRWLGGSCLGLALITFVGFCALLTFSAGQASKNSAAQKTKVALTSVTDVTQASLSTSTPTAQISVAEMNPDSGSDTPVPSTSTPQMPPTPPVTGYLYSYESHHSITHFAQASEQLGGVSQLGYPITEPFVERNMSDGELYWVQYFEKAVLEYHSDAPDGDKVQLVALGAWQLSRRYPDGLPAVPPAVTLPGESSYSHMFNETGHAVSGPFLRFWHDGGELKRFGYPISPPIEEKNEDDGKMYVIQYFERAVMQHHPEDNPPNDVQLAAIGSKRLNDLYPTGAPGGANNAIPTPSPTNTALPTATPSSTSTPLPTPPITVDLVSKEFVVGYYEDGINIGLRITNQTTKDIRGFKGIIHFSDLFGSRILSVGLTFEDEIKAGQSVAEQRGVSYNPYSKEDNRLADIELKDLRIDFVTTQVIFTDGTELFMPITKPSGGPDYQEIMNNYNSLTSAKWQEYKSEMEGTRVTNWIGWVTNVSKNSNSTSYKIRVDSERPAAACDTGRTDIEFELAQDMALKLNKCDKIEFSGVIKEIDCGLGILGHCTVKMTEVVLTSP